MENIITESLANLGRNYDSSQGWEQRRIKVKICSHGLFLFFSLQK